jgi:hypothetical protein
MKLSSYLFAAPSNGPYLTWIIVLVVLFALVAVAATIGVRRSGFIVIRRRLRRLRTISATTATLLAVYVIARLSSIGLLSWRIWLYTILVLTTARLVVWGVTWRSAAHDKVVERQARQKQAYFRKQGKRPAKRRKRR